ncbi:hypothetical protein V1264_016849 [Littorina saxatilis]
MSNAAENNGCLDFPTLSSNRTVRARENAAVNLPFTIKPDTECLAHPGHETFIEIYRSTDMDKSGKPMCTLVVFANKTCTAVPDDNCECDAEAGTGLSFSRRVTLCDSGVWIWKTGYRNSLKTKLLFDVQPSSNCGDMVHGDIVMISGVVVGSNVVTAIVTAIIF